MTIELKWSELPEYEPNKPAIRIKLDDENEPAYEGWELQFHDGGHIFWLELWDSAGNNRGGVTVDLYYLTQEILRDNDPFTPGDMPADSYNYKVGHPNLIIDDAAGAGALAFATPFMWGEDEDDIPESIVSVENGVRVWSGTRKKFIEAD